MNASQLISQFKDILCVVQEPKTPLILKGITSNSEEVKEGYLFIAEKGLSKDGHQYLSSAIKNGAQALLVENTDTIPAHYQGLILTTKNTRAMAPQVGAFFYKQPSHQLFCVGVTGTNGKTSVTYLVEHFFNSAQRLTGVIGTINHHLSAQVWQTENTTPHSIEIQRRINDFVQLQAQTLALEVSSHALDQKRIEGIAFDVGIFTNLTRDHLDYHSTMQDYFETKQRFFTETLAHSTKKDVFAIINQDDPWGLKMKTPPRLIKWTYGADTTHKNTNDFYFILNEMTFERTSFRIHTPFGSTIMNSPLIGVHNIYNVISATAAGLAGGISLQHLESALLNFKGIPGRLQRVPNNSQKSIFIDYAHSPDALENVLQSIQNIKKQFHLNNSRILCVFGCGGDRDKGKRPLMAGIAEKYSDLVFITSDNPRTEDPLNIINDIKVGFKNNTATSCVVEPDRQQAITLAINEAKKDDIVLIAGKGHEDYQIIGKEKFYFSDFETARKILT